MSAPRRFETSLNVSSAQIAAGRRWKGERVISTQSTRLLIPEEAAPQFLDDAAPRNGMMPPPDSEMIAPPITE